MKIKKVFLALVAVALAMALHSPTYGQDKKANNKVMGTSALKAAQLMEDYEKTGLQYIAYSGVLPVDSIKTYIGKKDSRQKNSGFMLWFCYDSIYNRIFLALEYIKEYPSDPAKLPTIASNDSLVKSFVIDYPTINATADNHLQDDNSLPPNPKNYKFTHIGKSDANKYINSFKYHFGSHCKYAFSCFTETDSLNDNDTTHHCVRDYKKLVKQNKGQFVRYYFGYQEKDSKGNNMLNKIRVIVVGVNDSGVKIKGHVIKNKYKHKISSTRTVYLDGDAAVLEDAYPPPPPVITRYEY